MKNILVALVLLSVVSAFAIPTEFKLISPTKMTIKDDQTLEITVKLACSNQEVLDFSSAVMSSDDSGDLAVVVAMGNCEATRDGSLKAFTLNADPKSHGYEIDQDVTFEPMNVK